MSSTVAVLMCAHNSAAFIREAIESILNQTYRDFEFIIVENGSTDGTWEVIQSYSDPRIRAFRTPLKQLTFNLNFGLIQTQAHYIARMDADDVAKPERLKRQVAYLDAHPEVAVLGTAFEMLNGKKDVPEVVVLPTTDAAIRKRLPFRFAICHPTVMFRREVIFEYGGYRAGGLCQDIDLWIRLSRDRTLQFGNLPESLLKYRVHPDQAKGRREGYIAVSSILLRESLVQRSSPLFGGFLLSIAKLLARSKRGYLA
ncbi:MAG: glycosyltransferase [Planctomycetota bacterium]|jgi:glycosyltransferase involved in cell wall biosynthesis|nr:glycosyltransferase [Planctomycetota bacterium]